MIVIRFIFSLSGPFIVSLGTYSGWLTLLSFAGYDLRDKGSLSSYLLYLALLLIFGWILESGTFRKHTPKQENSSNQSEVAEPKANAVIGFVSGTSEFIVNSILEKNYVTFYDVFKRPPYWKTYDERHKEYPIFRLIIRKPGQDKRSLEVRYLKGEPGMIHFRETPAGSNTFGDWNEDALSNWSFLWAFAPIEFLKQRFLG